MASTANPAETRPIRSASRTALGGAFWTASGWGLAAVFRIAFGLVIARLLGPRVLGIYAAALVVIGFSEVLGTISIGPALVQRKSIGRREVSTALGLSAAISMALGALVWLGAPAVAAFYRIPELSGMLRVLAFVFPLRGVSAIPRAMLQRELAFKRLAATEVAAYLCGFGLVAVSLAAAGFGLTALIVANLSQAAVELVLLLWARPIPPPGRFDPAAARSLLTYGGGVTLTSIFGFAAFQIDKLIVGRVLGATPLGLYSRAHSLMSLSTKMFAKVSNTTLFPLLSRLQGRDRQIRGGLRGGLALSGLTLAPLAAVVVVLAPEIIQTLLGEAWLDAATPLRILILVIVFRGADKLCGPVIMAAGKVYQLGLIQAVFAVLTGLGVWLGTGWGIAGVAGGVAIAILIHSLLLLESSLRIVGGHWSLLVRAWSRPLGLGLLTGLVTWAAATLLRAHLPSAPWAALGALVPVTLTAALILMARPDLALDRDTLAMVRRLEIPDRFRRWLAPRDREVTASASQTDRQETRDEKPALAPLPTLIYILGTGHNGSTLLNLLLNGHPRVVGLSALRALNTEAAGKDPVLDTPFWQRVEARLHRDHGRDLSALDLGYPGIGRLLRWDRDRIAAWAETNRLLLSAIGEVSEADFVVDASKAWQRLYLLEKSGEFDVRVIHLVRDGRAVVHSYLRKYGRFGFAFRRWAKVTLASLWLRRRWPHDHWLTVRYEDLARHPADALCRITQFLEISSDPRMLRFRSHPHHGLGGNRMRHGSDEEIIVDERWRRDLARHHRLVFALLGGWLNRLYGYRRSQGETA